jgi:hypothetical protein
MKYSFANPDQVSMIAENEADRRVLTYFVENRVSAGFFAATWQDTPGADATIARVNFLSIEERK